MKTHGPMHYHRQGRLCILFASLFLGGLFFLSCQSGNDNNGTDLFFTLYHGDCKDSTVSPASQDAGEDCLTIDYSDGDILSVLHSNAGFNCCPGEIVADIVVEDGVITITEKETEAGCHCLCLFDIHYEISGIPPGDYTMHVVEPYLAEGDRPLTCQFRLSPGQTDTCCVERSDYPWGL